MLTVIKEMPNQGAQEILLLEIERAYYEARQFLLGIPEDINIRFDNEMLIEDQGVGGYAYSPDTLTVAFDLTFPDKDKQLVFLRETIFHGAMHLAQNFTKETFNGQPIDEMVYEGVATVFEREKAGSSPEYGQYEEYDEAELKSWIAQIRKLDEHYDYKQWKFYNDEIGERWVFYKAGTYVVDMVMRRTGKTIFDVAKLSPTEVLEIARV